MSWTAITVDELKHRKVAALVEALQAAALGDGQADPVEQLIASVTETIRANVKSCAANVLDADTTKIPGDLLDLGCRLVLYGAKGRLEIPLTQDERDQKASDERTLERIADCKLAIAKTDNPETTETVASPASTPRIFEPTRTFSRTSQDGI